MLGFALSAVSYADIAFFAIIGLMLVVGLFGGLHRAFKGLFFGINVILISVMIVGVTLAPIQGTALGTSLDNAILGSTAKWGEAFTSVVYMAKDENGKVIDGSYYIQIGDQSVSLDEATGEGGLIDGAKAKLAAALAKRFINADNEGKITLAEVASDYITSIVVAVILFLIYCIALGIIFFLLRKVFKSMHESDKRVVKVVDRVLGGVMSALMAMIVLLLVLAILKLLAAKIPAADEYLTNSPVVGLLYNKNPISMGLSKIFGKN